MKPISLELYKANKDFVEDLKSGALFEQLKPKEQSNITLLYAGKVKERFTEKSDLE